MKRLLVISTMLLILFTQPVLSTIRHVPGSYTTIQAALNACVTGDTVLVAPGTYNENLVWPLTLSIRLISSSGSASTIIDGGAVGRVINISMGADNLTLIDGFTIRNGYSDYGAGIACNLGSSPTIKNNLIIQNVSSLPVSPGGGGGVAIGNNSSPKIINNTIYGNSAANVGGGIAVAYSSSPVIDNNVINNNSAVHGGGGIFVYTGCSPIITNNQIKFNVCTLAEGGGICLVESSCTIKHNCIEYNTCDSSGAGVSFIGLNMTLLDSNTIRYNASNTKGGGIGLYNSSPTISNNTISYNKAYYGGGINCEESSNPVIIGNRIEFDTAYNYGGGIRCKPNSSPTIRNNYIGNNYADSGGAGIIGSYNCSPLIEHNTITENVVFQHGAGVFLAYDCMATVRHNLITRNQAITGAAGGIICMYNSNSAITKNRIDSNSCILVGAAIFVRQSSVTTDSNKMAHNLGTSTVFFQNSSCQLKHNVIDSNSSIGIQIEYDNSTIRNNEISKNGNHGISCEEQCNSTINFNNLCDNYGCGVFNIDVNTVVNAESNWWGHPSGPYHPQTNPSGSGDTVSDYVDYTPWLTVIKVGSESKVVSEYYLGQNYPNPFNPKTSIRFELPKPTPVKLIVYDLLGKEVAVIVNQELKQGVHVVDWDASAYSSGVYFYSLEAGDYIETRKMILLK